MHYLLNKLSDYLFSKFVIKRIVQKLITTDVWQKRYHNFID